MKWFRATTESGTEYSSTGEREAIKITPGPGSYGHETHIRSSRLVIIPQEKLAEWANADGHIDWDWINDQPSAEAPVVGSHLLVSDMSQWRLSTPIVKVEEK